ncbi:hypothetical protein HU200_031270 [Digitaria exilis]|uniref:Uncharacterized protein n=1 Tax=Digitaria exilis TaxID=1010633 RepID=A0A835ETD9_9POAL|nr:hypothetical protein HU200_031270 [Digitaria exilis]
MAPGTSSNGHSVCRPPPGLNKTTYLISASGMFFTGVTQVVVASVRAPGGRAHPAGTKLAYACLVSPVAVAACLTMASLL